MTEALPLATHNAADQRLPVPTSEIPLYHQVEPPAPLLNEETADDDDGEIACICSYTSDDGSTVQCDKCLRWQHISCYYPPPKKVPDDDQKHYCVDCVPQPDLDPRKAAERQRRALEQHNGTNGVKRPATKTNKKKAKDSPSLNAQTNGWSERQAHLYTHDRKSASPRDQQPPTKKPKISHRSNNSISNASGRKRAGPQQVAQGRSPSKSPELNTSQFIPQYSDEFLHLFQAQSEQVETDTNLMDNISVSLQLSDWLTNPEALSKATGGLAPSEIFKRWDGSVEDIPGRPEAALQFVEDTAYETDGITPRWAQLIIENEVATGTFIGELRGRIGHKHDYVQDADSRWSLLHHPEPFVFFHPQLPICIDARQEGTRFRYVRRSCQPNAELQTIITEGVEYHFCFMATRDIMAGEEVTVAWQVPDSIRDRINSSLKTSSNFQPKVREYISTWISKVLANCGPCACNTQSGCLMAHYDRRGMSPPAPAAKALKRKRKVPMLDTAIVDRSRSTSEVRKVDNEDDGSASRSASGSQASASRDITPNTHYSTAPTKGMTELSERERKKLMREEEMFRRQEAESGKQKKKRNSSGSALNTPSATTSKPLSLQPNGQARSADSGARPSLHSRSSGGSKRKVGGASRPSRKDTSQAEKPPTVTYVDAGVQCDLDPSDPVRRDPPRSRRRYVSVTQRLLARCLKNTSSASEMSSTPVPSSSVQNAVDIDGVGGRSDEPPPTKHDTMGNMSFSGGAEPAPAITHATDVDTAMADADNTLPANSQSPDVTQKTPKPPPASVPPVAEVALVAAEPPAPPWGTGPNHKPVMHLDMPPPPSSMSLSAAATAFAHGQAGSGTFLTGTPLSATPLPLFSPSVTASVLMSPSPVRKKMSLSDYTKRSKAARESGGAEVGTPLATPAAGNNALPPWSSSEQKEDSTGSAAGNEQEDKADADATAISPKVNGTGDAGPAEPVLDPAASVTMTNGSSSMDVTKDDVEATSQQSEAAMVGTVSLTGTGEGTAADHGPAIATTPSVLDSAPHANAEGLV